MTTWFGRNTKVGFGKESVYGTAVARANWHCAVSADVSRKLTTVPRPHLCSGAGGVSKGHSLTRDETMGTLEFILRYRGMGLLFENAMGTVADAGAGPYTHTFTLGPPDTQPSLTAEIIRGTSTNSEVVEGVKINRLTISVAAGGDGHARCRAEVLAETAAAVASAGSPTDGDDVPVLFHQASQFAFNGNNYDLASLELVIDSKLARRDLLGSAASKQHQPTENRTITGRVVLEIEDALYAAHLADTQGDAVIGFVGDGNDALDITIQNARITSQSAPINTQGIVRQTLEFVAEDDGTDLGLEIVFTNDDATYEIN